MKTIRPRYADSEVGLPSRAGIVKLCAFAPTVLPGPPAIVEDDLKYPKRTRTTIVNPTMTTRTRDGRRSALILRRPKSSLKKRISQAK